MSITFFSLIMVSRFASDVYPSVFGVLVFRMFVVVAFLVCACENESFDRLFLAARDLHLFPPRRFYRVTFNASSVSVKSVFFFFFLLSRFREY